MRRINFYVTSSESSSLKSNNFNKIKMAATDIIRITKDTSPQLIFIVEDNMTYLKSLQLYLKEKFPETEIAIFPLGELCIHSLHLNPDFIILDYYLDTKYAQAATGLQLIKQIRAAKQNAKIIVLSSQENIEIALSAVKNKGCSYVKKGSDAYEKVYSIILKTVNKKVKTRTILKNNAQTMEQQVINGETCL